MTTAAKAHIQAIKPAKLPQAPHFTGKPADEPPKHVPEKFKKVWATLPGCCKNFYVNPGGGCCKGMPEPSPGKMSDGKAPPPKEIDACQISGKGCATNACQSTKTSPVKPTVPKSAKKTEKATEKRSWLASIGHWFKTFLQGMWDDLRRLLKGPKSDEKASNPF